MKPETLTHIRKSERQSMSGFADRLELNFRTLKKYEAGEKPIPVWLSLAVTCIYRRVTPLD